MSIRDGLFSSEAVAAGHPDKLCDRISDSIVDAFLERDPHARVACETVAADGKILLAGEFRTRDPAHYEEVRDASLGIVRRTLRETGYGTREHDIDPDSCEIEVRFNRQSPEIGAGVDGAGGLAADVDAARADEARGGAIGAGDQGMMFGYATTETEAHMPMAWALANDLVAAGTELLGAESTPLKPDGKSQVTVRYRNGQPQSVAAVVLSWQHRPDIDLSAIRTFLRNEVVDRVIPTGLRSPGFRCLINPAGSWTIGGPKGDTGVTGRKIIVDTYGGACPHGGGAFSGKDPSKVDRSGAYAARWVARNVVAAGLAERCTVQLAYAIGVAEPVSVSVDTHGTSAAPEARIEAAVRSVFDLTPGGIIEALDLLRPIYADTASLGHFGRWRDPEVHRWERIDRVEELINEVGAAECPAPH